ncbi:MAG: hypothetical protein J7L45_00330 [Candidatus Aenigmarchaeota archaeon]|nr:hypothetical protein [Candidatus Aenigmarchaeota archaeon]
MKGSTRFAIGTLLKILTVIVASALILWLLASIYGDILSKISGGLA